MLCKFLLLPCPSDATSPYDLRSRQHAGFVSCFLPKAPKSTYAQPLPPPIINTNPLTPAFLSSICISKH